MPKAHQRRPFGVEVLVILVVVVGSVACRAFRDTGYLRTFCEGIAMADSTLQSYDRGGLTLEEAVDRIDAARNTVNRAASDANDDSRRDAALIRETALSELSTIRTAMFDDRDLGKREFDPGPARASLLKSAEGVADCSDPSRYRDN